MHKSYIKILNNQVGLRIARNMQNMYKVAEIKSLRKLVCEELNVANVANRLI